MKSVTQWIKNIWIFRIFADEFGSSDVRSNYSRVYSWMANQLGHFTLGFMTALVFYWLAYDAETWIRPVIAFLAIVFLVLMVDRDLNLGKKLGLIISLMILVGLVTLFFCILVSIVADTICSCAISSYVSDCKTVARFTITCVVVAFLVWFIARKDRFFRWLGFIIASLCVFLNLAAASSLWVGSEQSDWIAAIVSVLISMAIWVGKEFGGDMPNVRRELKMARCKRKQRSSGNNTKDKGKCLDKRYLETAKWDSQTDTMFYLAGAWVSAGIILASQSAQNDPDWLAPAVIWSGIAFLICFFLACGKIWAYRQQAVDRTGATHGNMMAVVDFNIKLLYGKRKVDEPRVKLYHFARGNQTDCCSLQHLVVFGAGRHNERLADALVTEAALASLPLKWFCKLKAECKWRKARKLSFARLRDYGPKNLTVRELLYNPVKDLYIEAKGRPKGDRRVVKVRPRECETCVSKRQSGNVGSCEDYEKVGAAGLVVVTRCDPDAICSVVAKLSENKYQNTVWCFDKKHMEWKKKILRDLRSKLGVKEIGVVYCC